MGLVSGSSESCPFDGRACLYGSAGVASCDDALSLQFGVDCTEDEHCVRAVGKVIKPITAESFLCPSDRSLCPRYFEPIHFGICEIIADKGGKIVFTCSRLKDWRSCGFLVERLVPKHLLPKK